MGTIVHVELIMVEDVIIIIIFFFIKNLQFPFLF